MVGQGLGLNLLTQAVDNEIRINLRFILKIIGRHLTKIKFI